MLNYQQIRQHYLENRKKPSPNRGSQILVIGFAVIILLGTVLLKLPIATQGPEPLTWTEALFTAASATTVTGLVVVSTAGTFSFFGQLVILFLIQVGGIGFIILSVVLFRLIGRRVRLFERSLLRQTMGVEFGQGIVQLTFAVLAVTVIIEFVGAVLFFSQYVQIMPWSKAAYFSVFHSISAFCNAGFDLFLSLDDPNLLYTRDNPFIIIVMCVLITIGALGITVVYDIIEWPKERHLSLHTRLVLPFSLILVVIGTSLMLVDEFFVEGHALSQLPVRERFWVALFTIVSSRTAGLTLIPMSELGDTSQMIVFIWMFIGGAPASMGGGVGLSTVAVVLLTLFATIRGYRDVRIFARTIPTETLTKAVAVLTVSTGLVVVMTMFLLLLNEGDLFPVAFEVVSAFSNTGYSLGTTGNLGPAARLLIVFTMFWGRLGPLTLVVALAQRHSQTLIRYPEEKIIIG